MRAATGQLASQRRDREMTVLAPAARTLAPARQGGLRCPRGQHPHRRPDRLRPDDRLQQQFRRPPERPAAPRRRFGDDDPGGRRDPGHNHPERGPVDRFRPGPLRLCRRGHLRPQPALSRHSGVCRRGRAWALLCGVVNGAIVVVARVPSLVVTLGTLYAIRGIDAIFVNGIQIDPSSIPSSFLGVGYETVLGVPWIFVIAAILVLLVGYVMRTFRPARDLYAIGSDPDAALLAGVPARKRVFFTFVLSGTIAGFAGGLWLSEFATVALGRRPRLRAPRDSGRRCRRRGHLRRQRDGAGGRARRHPPQHHQPGTRRRPHIRLLGRGSGGRPPDHRHRFRPVCLPAA